MPGGENQMWGDHVRPAMAAAGMDPIRVENRVHPGTPDVSFIEGWVELKSVKAWPKKTDSVLKIDHFTPVQRVWLLRRWTMGGNVWMMLRVGREWMLFDGHTASQLVGRVEPIVLCHTAVIHTPAFDQNLFINRLKQGRS